MDVISRHPDGGATLRLSNLELVRFYNLLNAFLQPSAPQELDWARKQGQIEQVEILAELVDMPRPTYGG
jgi:hypothetical protein